MANRRFGAARSYLNRGVIVAGNFDAESGVTDVNEGVGVDSVSREAAGEYKVILEDQFNELHGATCSLEVEPTVSGLYGCDVTDYDVTADEPYVEFATWEDTTDNHKDISGAKVHFTLVLSDSDSDSSR